LGRLADDDRSNEVVNETDRKRSPEAKSYRLRPMPVDRKNDTDRNPHGGRADDGHKREDGRRERPEDGRVDSDGPVPEKAEDPLRECDGSSAEDSRDDDAPAAVEHLGSVL